MPDPVNIPAGAIAARLDVTGLPCPIPVLKTKKALADLAIGDLIEVLGSDPASKADMAALCLATGNVLLAAETTASAAEAPPVFRFLIRKAAPSRGT